MDAISEYLNMSGYGGFIWPAYAIVTVVLVGLMVLSRRSLKDARNTLEDLERGQ